MEVSLARALHSSSAYGARTRAPETAARSSVANGHVSAPGWGPRGDAYAPAHRGRASGACPAERAVGPAATAASSGGSATSRSLGPSPGPRDMASRSAQGDGLTSSRWDGKTEKAGTEAGRGAEEWLARTA